MPMTAVLALWPFSLRVYHIPGVADACLALQERRRVDVNILLWCCWRAVMGGGVCSADELREAVCITATWQEEIVAGLRSVRRALKPRASADPDVAALRDEVKRLELEAERLEQQVLERLGNWTIDPGRILEDRRHDAVLSLTAYMRIVDGEPDPTDRRDIAAIAAACVVEVIHPAGERGSA